ncbi:hypothetical protein YPPY63_3047, partial [Yersinia pestis PY-63]
MPFHP